MPDVLHAYRVFIASPGGLERERAEFRAAVNHHNESDAIERGVIFLPVGWELTPGGVGRPQHLINKDVRRCDFFVLVLGDRWGSAPQAEGEEGFSSGSEEEFTIATQCYDEQSMRDLVVFFKTPPPEKVADPGPQLSSVLEFRRQLEAEKKLLFESFDEMAAFREKLQRHLARWVRDHEKGQSRSRPDVPMAQPVAADSARFVRPASVGDPPSDSAAVRGADELVSEGRVTEANAVLARAFVNDDLAAMHRYASMQARAGNRSAAESSFRRLQEVAHRQGDIEWEVASLTGLAGVFRSLERRGDEEGCHREALHVREERLGPEHPDVAKSLNVLAEFLSENGRPQEALSLLERALAIQGFPDAA